MSELKIGDVVQLKSGGPAMTVKNIDNLPDEVDCTWFVNDKAKYGAFNVNALRKVDGPGEPIR